MIISKWENEIFFSLKNILREEERIDLVEGLSKECLKSNIIPKYQTGPDLHLVFKNNNYTLLLNHVLQCVSKIGKYNLKKSWCNYINNQSNFFLHNHNDMDLSCVYYLQNTHPQYGTYFIKEEKEIIILGYQNSLQIFNSKLQHELVFPPKEILRQQPRLSIAFDFVK